MVRQKKIRGHNRLYKQIDLWRDDNLTLNLNSVKKNERGRIDIIVHPWCDLCIVNSSFPEPRGKTRNKILTGLLDIYQNWKKQLDSLNEPYYLKIWLYEERFSKSQVVCALGGSLNYYQHTFRKPKHKKKFNTKFYGILSERLDNIIWELGLDEDIYDNTTVGDKELYSSAEAYEEMKTWFNRKMKRPHRTEKLKDKIEDVDELYCFKRGSVWVGG